MEAIKKKSIVLLNLTERGVFDSFRSFFAIKVSLHSGKKLWALQS